MAEVAEARAVWEASDVYAWTENTITDEEAFFREIDKVRQLGYALDNEENEVGVRCIAAAIPDYRGRAFYAISLSAPTSPYGRRAHGMQLRASAAWLREPRHRAARSAAARDADEGDGLRRGSLRTRCIL